MDLKSLKAMLSDKPKAEHPNIKKNGKVYFWNLTTKSYMLSACQPKGKSK